MQRALFLLLLASPLAVADDRCAPCHAPIAAAFAKSPKALSLSKPKAEIQLQRQWIHDFSARFLSVQWQSGKLIHSVQQGRLASGHIPAWAIGSGQNAKSYAVPIADALFLSPITWYANRLIWDATPGFITSNEPDFNRPITPECLTCHAGAISPIYGTASRYQAPPEPIGCNRCHGDPSAHLAQPAKANIVNPVNLPAPRRDAVCESCHLQGEARVLNPGKQFRDFQPGQPLEDTFSIYVSKPNSNDTVLRVSSHSEQLNASLCAIKSAGKLWCGTCHPPHAPPAEKTKAAFYRDKCVTCHPDTAEVHAKNVGDDCVRCHMPRTKSYDGSHGAYTDHWIRTAKSEHKFIDRGEYLRPWRQPPANLSTRNLGLAYFESSQRNRSLKRLREGVQQLSQAAQQGHTDSAVAQVFGVQFLNQNQPDRALPWLKQAVATEPKIARGHFLLATALAKTSQPDAAKAEAEQAIQLDPLLEDAYALLAEIEPKRADYWKSQFRKQNPKRLLAP